MSVARGPPPPPPAPPQRRQRLAEVLYDYTPSGPRQIPLVYGERVEYLATEEEWPEWSYGRRLLTGQTGYFPSNYVAPLPDSPPAPVRGATESVSLPRLELGACVPSWVLSPEVLVRGGLIGTGAFGTVYRGTLFGEQVAIKLLPYSAERPELVQLLKREAELLSSFAHKNVVQFKGASLEPHALCIVMEYAPGGSLFSFLRHRAHELDAQRTLNWAIDVACGMKYLCEEAPTPIVHRDLKSHNLLIAGNGRLKISDFGVARVAATQAGMMSSTAGTFAYMAVECITQREYSQKSDVWSFGVVLWELITGQVPYDLIEPFAVAYGVATGQLRLPVPAGCPPVYRGLMEACWARDPSARPTFAQLQRRLEEDGVLESEGQRASLPSLRDQWSPEMTSRLDDIHQWELSLRDKEQELLYFKDELLQREASLSKREENMRLYERVYELNRRATSPPSVASISPLSSSVDIRAHGSTPRLMSVSMNERHAKSRSFGQSPISSPFNFRHLSHVGKSADDAFDVTQLVIDWRDVERRSGLSEQQLALPRVQARLADLRKQRSDPYPVVRDLLPVAGTDAPVPRFDVLHEELHRRLAHEFATVVRRDEERAPDQEVRASPPHAVAGAPIFVQWSMPSARDKDMVGLIPQNGRVKDAVGTAALHSRKFGSVTVAADRPGVYYVAVWDKTSGRILLRGGTVVVAEPSAPPGHRRRRSHTWSEVSLSAALHEEQEPADMSDTIGTAARQPHTFGHARGGRAHYAGGPLASQSSSSLGRSDGL